MKSIISVLVVVAAASASFAQEAHQAKSRSTDAVPFEMPDYVCPLWPMMAVDEGIMYYCDNFPNDDCNETPDAAYLVGAYQWPAECPSQCEGVHFHKERQRAYEALVANGKRRAIKTKLVDPFPGFPGAPKPPAFEHVMPAGQAAAFSRRSGDPWFLRFTYTSEQKTHVILAKVFDYTLNVGQADGEPVPRYRTMSIAFEVADAGGERVHETGSQGVATVGGSGSRVFQVKMDRLAPVLVIGAATAAE